jgi:hypothetical protein
MPGQDGAPGDYNRSRGKRPVLLFDDRITGSTNMAMQPFGSDP